MQRQHNRSTHLHEDHHAIPPMPEKRQRPNDFQGSRTFQDFRQRG